MEEEWYPSLPLAPFGLEAVDVSVLRVAIDTRAIHDLRTELARLSTLRYTATTEGRVEQLQEAARLLGRLRDAWLYGGAFNVPMQDPDAATAEFDRQVDDTRLRFPDEPEPGNAPALVAGGLVLVTLVLAARIELFKIESIGDGNDLSQALEAAAQLTVRQLVSFELIYQPARADRPVTSLELEAKYPRPQLFPINGALVGKVFCSFCAAPYPLELGACPRCGAPR